MRANQVKWVKTIRLSRHTQKGVYGLTCCRVTQETEAVDSVTYKKKVTLASECPWRNLWLKLAILTSIEAHVG